MTVTLENVQLLPPLVIPICDVAGAPRSHAAPSLAHEPLLRSIVAKLNVDILHAPGTESAVSLPNDSQCQLIVPVSRWRMRDAVSVMRAFAADPARIATVSANLVFGFSTASYIKDRCPDFPMSPATARRRAWKATGFLPSVDPVWERTPDRARALSVRRSHYTLEASCCLTDLERMLGALANAGLIGQRGAPGALADVDSPDWRAIVLTAPAEPGTHVETCDEARTRRIMYSAPRRLSDSDTAVLGALAAEALIDRAQVYAANCDRDRPDRWNWEPSVRPIKA